MDDKRKRMTDKVAKLLRQAEDVAGTPEEAVFQARAFEILAKYGLDMAVVTAHKDGLDVTELPDAIQWVVQIRGKYISQQGLLLHGMARALHCKSIYRPSTQELFVYGVPRHIERMQFLWGLLRPQMMRLATSVRPDDPWVNTTTYRRAWIAGYAQTIQERLNQEETKAVESAGGGALVLYRGDKERAALALRKAHPRVRSGRRLRFDANGYAHGQRDGRQAAFNHSIGA